MRFKISLYCCAALMTLLSAVAAANDTSVATADAVAPQDEVHAMIQLAARYEHAEGVARNFQHAAHLYCRAARMGRAEAQYRLGWMYANGRGVVRDDAAAAELFRMAAAQGHEQAQRMLRYVRPVSPAAAPACLSVAEWVPALKMSQEIAPVTRVRVAENARHETRAADRRAPTAQLQ